MSALIGKDTLFHIEITYCYNLCILGYYAIVHVI